MEGSRRQYSEEFKKDAVGHSLISEKTVEEVAQELEIAHSNLRRWRTQYAKNREPAFPGNGKQKVHSTRRGDQKARKRAGIEGLPSILRRRCKIDHLPVRGLVRSKVYLGFKISA